MERTVAYIHGFNSSPMSFKAGLLRIAIDRRARGARFLAPSLPPSPAAAARLLEDIAHAHPRLTLVGSSLGGYYATWLAERFSVRAVLLNPAVRPYELLAGYVGPQTNIHTGTIYNFTTDHVAELQALETEAVSPDRYMLIVTTGDEVLDYRDAVRRYAGAKTLVIEGGDHGMSDFAGYVDATLDFCDVAA